MNFDRRRYAREWARARRAHELSARNRGERCCQKRHGRFGKCGGILETRVLMGGWTKTACPRCALVIAGKCIDCGSPVAGMMRKALRCAMHTRAARLAASRRYRAANRAKLNCKAKSYGRCHKNQRNEYKRLWRKVNPDKVKAQKRRYALRQPTAQYEYQRTYRAAGHAKQVTGQRTCLTCATHISGRAKRCYPCKERARLGAMALLGRAA